MISQQTLNRIRELAMCAHKDAADGFARGTMQALRKIMEWCERPAVDKNKCPKCQHEWRDDEV
jgi:hypothetical protein